MERPVTGRDLLVKGGIKIAHGSFQAGVKAGDQPRPQRGDGAGSADNARLSVHENLVAGLRVGVGGDIGHAAAGPGAGIERGRKAHAALESGDGEDAADAATGGTASVRCAASRRTRPERAGRQRRS